MGSWSCSTSCSTRRGTGAAAAAPPWPTTSATAPAPTWPPATPRSRRSPARRTRSWRAYRQERGWAFPWYSSYGSDFNYDFHVSLDPAVTPNSYNFRAGDELAAAGQAWLIDHVGEQPGVSAFLRDGDEVFHTYAVYGRGVEVMMHAYRLLDITALGRHEDWEEPKGRVPAAHAADPSFTS